MENLKGKPKQILSAEEKVREFQRKLYRKAKQEKDFRFYILYDKICSIHFLTEAYKRVKKNGGSPGIDGITFEAIEQAGLLDFLSAILQELKDKTYKPQPVKRVMIPKANGKMRPLGIPTIKDRVIQMSCKMVIEPIFESDFEDCSYGFRPKRSAQAAIGAIKRIIRNGRSIVYDADLSKYFDTIPHDKLMLLIAQKISDGNVLGLIKMWLKSPVEENGKLSGGKKCKLGTPQGGVISPLLANIYLDVLDKSICDKDSSFSKYRISIVRYADDFVLLGKRILGSDIRRLEKKLIKMGLELNKEKTRLVKAEEEPFDFLGFTIRYNRSILYKNGYYWNISPSEKSMKNVRGKIKEYLKYTGHLLPEVQVQRLNQIIRGWLNYYTIDGISHTVVARNKLRFYLSSKLYRHYRRKSQRKSKLYRRGAFGILVKRYGLIDPIYYSPKTSVKA